MAVESVKIRDSLSYSGQPMGFPRTYTTSIFACSVLHELPGMVPTI
jgi:hypothetical protein